MAIQYHLSGEVGGVFLGLAAKTLETTSQAKVKVTFEGFEGDKHAGLTRKSDSRTPYYPRGTEIRNDRQISIVSKEELAQIAARMQLSEVLPEWLGANLLLQGIPNLTQLPPGTRLFFSAGVTLVVQAENLPCKLPGKVIQSQTQREGLAELFPQIALHLRGLVACVERPGIISAGESLQADIPQQVIYRPR
jgi:hypothetical protein